jgi:hypothetical protein
MQMTAFLYCAVHVHRIFIQKVIIGSLTYLKNAINAFLQHTKIIIIISIFSEMKMSFLEEFRLKTYQSLMLK